MSGIRGGHRPSYGGPARESGFERVFPLRKRASGGFRMAGERRLFGLPAGSTGNCRKLGSLIFVVRLLAYGSVYITIQPYREQEKRAPRTADSPVLGVFTSVQASSFANARSVPHRFVLSEMASRRRRRYDRRYGARSGS